MEAHPHITAIIERMDSDILDAIAMLWYTAKGYPDPRDKVLGAQSISIPHWRTGDMVPYSEIFDWMRSDVYLFDDEAITAFDAMDLYCVTPGCDCGQVLIQFRQLTQNKPQTVGIVDVNLSGAIVLKPEPGQEKTLNLLWAAFRKRHSAYLARFARHDADMKLMGAKVKPQTTVNSSPKIGRNEPCPCGSGKKYKKCCWV